MRLYRHIFRVTGRGTFPLDMLRYDMCYPTTGMDVDAIAEREHGREPRVVVLATAGKPKHWQPTCDRWSSFLWSVDPSDIDVVEIKP